MKLFIKDGVYRKMRLYNFPQSPVAPLLIAALSIFSFGHANAQSVYINMGKGWSYITGAQRSERQQSGELFDGYGRAFWTEGR